MIRFCVVVSSVVIVVIQAVSLPPYIKICSRSDPKLNECSLKSGNEALPHIVKGEKSLKLPILDPLLIPEIVLEASSQLSIKLTKVKATGLKNAVILDAKADLKSRSIGGTLSIPKVVINGDYDINGKLLIIPIQGTGPATVVFDNLVLRYIMDYNLIVKPDGKEYVAENFVPSLSYTVGNVSFKFDNLFNGDKNLGDRTNEFLNEHSKEISDDFSTAIADTLKYLITNILKNFVSSVPYDEVFSP